MITRQGPILATFSAALALAAMIATTPVEAGMNPHLRAIKLGDTQSMLTQKMSKEILLVALGIGRDENLKNLETSRDLFRRMLWGLRHGDSELGLRKVTNPDLLQNLDAVEDLWRPLDTAIRTGLEAGSVSQDQVDVVAYASLPLLHAVARTADGYESDVSGRVFSMLSLAMRFSSHQQMLTQKMSKEFLLIAYGYDDPRSREGLITTCANFERILQGLLVGDGELRLMPAPTPEIRAQLLKVERLWHEVHPAMRAVGEGRMADWDTIAEVVQHNSLLSAELSKTVGMYEAL